MSSTVVTTPHPHPKTPFCQIDFANLDAKTNGYMNSPSQSGATALFRSGTNSPKQSLLNALTNAGYIMKKDSAQHNNIINISSYILNGVLLVALVLLVVYKYL